VYYLGHQRRWGTLKRFVGRFGTAWQLLPAALVAVALAGCSSGPEVNPESASIATSGSTQVQIPATAAASTTSPMVEYESSDGPFPTMCSEISGKLIADAAGVGEFGAAVFVDTPDAVSNADSSVCTWRFEDPNARTQLGLEPPSSRTDYDVEVETNKYAGLDFPVDDAQPDVLWTDADPEILIHTFVEAHKRTDSGTEVPRVVPDTKFPTARYGSDVVTAVTGDLWTRITFCECSSAVCGQAAVSVAAAITPRVAAAITPRVMADSPSSR
jgi:hypothetical protein